MPPEIFEEHDPLLGTHFAPPERASAETLTADYDYLSADTFAQTLVDSVPDIVLILNQERQVVFANERAVQMLNFANRRDMLGLRPGELVGCAHADDLASGCGTTEFCRTCGAVKAILSSLQGADAVEECRILLQNGDALDLQVWARPCFVGERQFSTFAVRDISHEKRRKAFEQVFFHDVLNTASAVAACVDVLKIAPEELGTLIDELGYISNRLLDEIKVQRILSMAESGELRPNIASLDIRVFLREIATLYRHHSVALGREIVVNDPTDCPTMIADSVLLGRVLGNMTKNALEASAIGETVTISTEFSETYVIFAVHNSGYMPRNVQLQVFNRSFSTKGGGRGLGTYSMKLLSERYLNGRVWFETDKLLGTTFYAAYPRQWARMMRGPAGG